MGLRGFGSRRAVEMVMSDKAATAVDSWKTRKFWMLRKMLLPEENTVSIRSLATNDLRTFFDGRKERRKVVVNQDHVCCFLGNVCPSPPHRYADVSHAQGGSIVHYGTKYNQLASHLRPPLWTHLHPQS